MKWQPRLSLSVLFFALFVGTVLAVSGRPGAPAKPDFRPPTGKDLIVHEWGVFTVFNDVKYANVNRAAEWGALPDFFYRQFPRERLNWAPAFWDKPVIYFYAKPQTSGQVWVILTFTEGAPVVWWPAAARPWDDGAGGKGAGNTATRPFNKLTWICQLGPRVEVQQGLVFNTPAPPPKWVNAEDFPLPKGCWLAEARLPQATQVTVTGTKPERGTPWTSGRLETERFIYYDGIVPAPNYVRCEKVEEKALTLRNRAAFDLTRLFVVDRRKKDVVGFFSSGSKESSLKARSTLKIEPKPLSARDWPDAGVKEVRKALLGAGLFEAEADALLKINRQGLFENEGVTVFHLLPQSEYDRMLPLQVAPEPSEKPVRVGIALHPHVEIEPDFTARVTALLRQLDDDAFEVREAASKALVEFGPPAASRVAEARAQTTSPEVRKRATEILDHVDAAEWLRKAVPPVKKPQQKN